MGLDAFRESRHINRVGPGELTSIWTAQSYRSEVTRAVGEIRSSRRWSPLEDLCREPIAQGRTPTYAANRHGYPCLKTKHIDGLVIGDDFVPDFVTAECAEQLKRFRVQPETVLMNRSGTGSIGRCSVYLGKAEPLTNEHVLHIRLTPEYDACYVATYLNSWWGQRAVEQGITGSTRQLNLANEHVARIPVPLPESHAQRFIGDKVRQAERLRERARRLEADVARTHAQYTVPPSGIDFAKRTRRLAARSLTERLDAHFYPSAVEQYFRHFNGATQSLDRLCSLLTNGQTQPVSANGVRQATVTNLGRSFVEGSLRTVQRPTDGSRALAPHDLLLCNAAHSKSYIGRDVTYSQVEGPYPSTEVMVVRVDRTQVPASFVRHHLKTQIGYLQIQSTIRGITAHSYPTDVRLIEIPLPPVPDAERQAWFATDDKMLEAGRCVDAASILTSVATALVERLIDGHITEADLVATQKALESGDRSADRDILKALRQSDTLDAKPLIADLDALYAFLDESEENDT